MPDLEVLHFARDHRPCEQTDVEMRGLFGSPARYYQRLGRAIDDPEVLETDPHLVYRLRRIRDGRHSKRARRTL